MLIVIGFYCITVVPIFVLLILVINSAVKFLFDENSHFGSLVSVAIIFLSGALGATIMAMFVLGNSIDLYMILSALYDSSLYKITAFFGGYCALKISSEVR